MFELKYMRDNYIKIIRAINLLSLGRRAAVSNMMDCIADKYFTCPASYKIDYNSCFPGGLAFHSIKVMQGIFKLIHGLQIKNCNNDSIILLSLFHDVGKIGDGINDFYLQNDDYWKSRGYYYKINDKFDGVSPYILSLYLLQKHNIVLTHDEYMAISYLSSNNRKQLYNGNEITFLLQNAIIWSVNDEQKTKLNLTEEASEQELKQDLPQILNS